MKKDYKNKILKFLPISEDGLEKLLNNIIIKEIPSGTILLFEGDIATKLFLVINGCMRAFFIKENGIEITSQFFIEGQMVASFESAMTGKPSRLYIDAIEDSIIGFIPMNYLEKAISESSSARDHFNKFLISRLIYYMNQHASFILDNPEKRYLKLIQENPELVSRLPQQYIASYLGITPVSLSRIRTRIKKAN
ncbi:MAG: Crp/Fnr family transcriptional regulator [Thermodesulfobacteriota bacterium]|jgi:CRP-like cAMP-binding protein